MFLLINCNILKAFWLSLRPLPSGGLLRGRPAALPPDDDLPRQRLADNLAQEDLSGSQDLSGSTSVPQSQLSFQQAIQPTLVFLRFQHHFCCNWNDEKSNEEFRILRLDWQEAAVPALLSAEYSDDPHLGRLNQLSIR